jgi:4-aminobutyrate aminotransferase-like enzyme
LVDEAGVSYLDTRNNVAHVGHGDKHVVDKVQKQLSILNTNTRYLHPNAVELARRLADKLPDPLEVVVFVNSGSEANDLALRLARAYTKSPNTIVVDRAYHGHTLATLDISPYKFEHSKEFNLKPIGPFSTPGHHIFKVPCPDTFRGEHRDFDAGEKYASYVQKACDFYKASGESVGAFFIEGGMSVAGVILPPVGYLPKSVEAVRAAGGVYVADEVQTGFGRLGACYWAFQHGNHGVVPDIVTVGKPFGNGMPLAAVVTTRKIADTFQEMGVEYFNTFGGNPVCCAAGLAVLDVLESENLQEHALHVGTYLECLFLVLKERIALIGDVRGCGLFIGIELIRDTKTLEPATAETSFICTQLKEKFQILTSIDGPHDNVLVVKPPLRFSKIDAEYFVDSFEMAWIELKALGDKVLKMKKTPT